MNDQLFWAPCGLIDRQWRQGVLLRVDASGFWAEITVGVSTPPADACILSGPVLPGMVNAHSHAFQRAFAGLAERRESAADDFWSWRDRMYGVANRISASQLQTIATQLYIEMLRGGYTQVCEFHYLHRLSENADDDALRSSSALIDAATQSGIGLTMLPTLYERASFKQSQLRADQQRFSSIANDIHRLYQAIQACGKPLVNAGIAIHSLRAASREAITDLLSLVGDDDIPVHIHIAEQLQEVSDCLAATGARPIEWLCREFKLDARWQLVHATHATNDEIESVAGSHANIVICPTTEANLGDGIADLPHWFAKDVNIAIGSDSHVCRTWIEELRLLEYGQRLKLMKRNVSASPEREQTSTAIRLFEMAIKGGGLAAGLPKWGLSIGARADLLVLDLHALLGVPHANLLDALVFATNENAISDVYVAGKKVIANGKHPQQDKIASQFERVMGELWGD